MSDKSPLQNCKEPDDRPEKQDLAEQNLKQVFVHVMRRSSIYKSDFWYKTEPRMCYINKNLPDYCIKKEGFKKPTRNINHILDQFSLASPINPGSSNYSRSFKTFFYQWLNDSVCIQIFFNCCHFVSPNICLTMGTRQHLLYPNQSKFTVFEILTIIKKMILHPVAAKHRMDQNYNCGIFSQTWPPRSPDTSSAPNVWLEYKINTQDIFLLLLILLRKYLFKICSLPQKIQRALISVF